MCSQINTRSSTAVIITTALFPARLFFILLTTSLTSEEFTTVAITFLELYVSSTVPLPLPDATVSLSLVTPFTS